MMHSPNCSSSASVARSALSFLSAMAASAFCRLMLRPVAAAKPCTLCHWLASSPCLHHDDGQFQMQTC